MAMNKYAAIEKLLEAVFSIQSMPGLYVAAAPSVGSSEGFQSHQTVKYGTGS
jgi:hypothetical protein